MKKYFNGQPAPHRRDLTIDRLGQQITLINSDLIEQGMLFEFLEHNMGATIIRGYSSNHFPQVVFKEEQDAIDCVKFIVSRQQEEWKRIEEGYYNQFK